MSKHRKALVFTLGGNPEKSYFTSNSRHSFLARGSNQGNLQSVLLLNTLAGYSTGSNFTKDHKNAENGQYMLEHQKALGGTTDNHTLPKT